METYLVTGGAGFIGSHIVHELINQGLRVKVLDNFSSGKKENLKGLLNDIKLIEGDLMDYHVMQRAIEGTDIIFHLGALPSVSTSIKEPLKTNSINATSTLQLLNLAVKNKVSRVIYAASSAVYGNNEELPKCEEMMPNPISPYGISKYTGELYCKVFHDLYGLETVSLRYFNVFGSRQDPNSEYAAVIPKFINLMLEDKSPIIYGDGRQTRDFVYIDNVVSANLLASKAPKLTGESINIGIGKQISLNQLTEKINQLLGKQIKPVYQNAIPGDIRHSLANIEQSYKLIGYKPIVSFEDGLKKTIKWFEES